MELTKIEFPEKRRCLIDYIKGLSDYMYQKDYWGKSHPDNPNFYDDFSQAIHFLYDDSDIAEDPDSWIGLVLLSQDESNLVKQLNESLENLFDKYGVNLSDKEFMDKPEWRKRL